MKPFKNDDNEDENVCVNGNDESVMIEVDEGVIDRVRSGDTTHIVVPINADNYLQFLENVKGQLVLVTDEMPESFCGCYLYNDGVFPYAIKESLQILVLTDGTDECVTSIVDVEASAGMRFRFQESDGSGVEDPNGDCCVWELSFEIVPLHAKPRTFLMRWNPAISSFSIEDYRQYIEEAKSGGAYLKWSICDWEEARRGDLFFMMRTGDDKAGIVFNGVIVSNPYVNDDWAGTSKRRLYVDMICSNYTDPDAVPRLSLEKLKSEIPSYDWSKGHSGEQLPQDVTEKLMDLWAEGDGD